MAEIKGLRELDRKLGELGAKLGGKVLRQSVNKATASVLREMRQAAPVGSKSHSTYKGNYAAPGYLRRNVVKVSRFSRGVASVSIGVRKEAFYGVQFLDEGVTVTQRKGKPIKPYTISGRHWFKNKFVANRSQMENVLRDELRARIDKVIGR